MSAIFCQLNINLLLLMNLTGISSVSVFFSDLEGRMESLPETHHLEKNIIKIKQKPYTSGNSDMLHLRVGFTSPDVFSTDCDSSNSPFDLRKK